MANQFECKCENCQRVRETQKDILHAMSQAFTLWQNVGEDCRLIWNAVLRDYPCTRQHSS